MITPRQLTPVVLVLALGSIPLRAQPAPQVSATPAATDARDKTVPAQPAPAAREQSPKSTPPAAGKDSPFDYRSSEEISEDVPVSFPVDI